MMSKVARNDASEAINNIIDAVSRHLQDNVELQKKIYSMTLDTLKTQNEKLWHTICLRLGKVYLEQHSYKQLDELLSVLKNSCRKTGSDQIISAPEGQDEFDQSKSNLLLETFALEIQMCHQMKDKQRLKKIYPKTMNLKAVISDPRVMGIIKECGGKMYMAEKRWA